MDLFDDILPGPPAARARPGGKFKPKVKSKQPPLKEISVDFEVGSVTKSIPDTDLNNATTQPVYPANAVENELNNVASPSTTCSTIGRMEEPPKNSNKILEVIDNSLQVSPNVAFKSASDDSNAAISESNIHSDFDFGKEREVLSAEFELDPFSNVLFDPGTGNAHKFQPKIKPRPRVGNTPDIASASSSVMMEKSVELPTCTNEVQCFQSNGNGSGRQNQSTSLPLPTSEILRTTDLFNKLDYMSSSIPFSEDNRSLAAVIPSQPDSMNAMPSEAVVHNGTRDWPSSFGKSAAETVAIFSGMKSLEDFLTQAATGKPTLNSFNEKGAEENFAIPACNAINSFGVCDTTQFQRCPEYYTTQDSLTFNEARVINEDDSHTNNSWSSTQEGTDLNPDCPIDNAFDYQSMKSDIDPTSEIPMHEELTNSADSPTLTDFLHQDVTREKEDDNERKSFLRKHTRSTITGVEDKGGKTSRQLRKQAARKPANNSLNEDVEDDDDVDPPYDSNRDEIQKNGDEYEVDNSSKMKRASVSSKKKSVVKNGKTSQKRKRANDDLEKTTKEPPKQFSHSTRRRKRCVDKALLDDENDRQTVPIRDIILLGDFWERLAKKEAKTSKTSSINQSGGDFLHETGANNEEEIFGSEDGRESRDPDNDQTSEKITSTPPLLNYQSFMDKTPRVNWSKEETEEFFKAVSVFGTDFSMIQLVFRKKTRRQVKLKYKKEERQHPLQLSDALCNRAKDLSYFKLAIEIQQQTSTKAEQDASRDASDFMPGEEVEDPTLGTKEEVAATKQDDPNVKGQEDSVTFHSPEQSDDSDDDLQRLQRWSQYKSDY